MKEKSILEVIFGVIVTVISLAILFGLIDGNSMFAGVFFLCTAIGCGITAHKKKEMKNRMTLL